MFQDYLLELQQVLAKMECMGPKGQLPLTSGVEQVISMIAQARDAGNKLLWIGNGGSAAIASHSAADYFRTGNIKTLCFSDPSLLTCIGNDFGYPAIFAKPIEAHAEPGDVLVAISSSGQSANILNAVDCALAKGCPVVTLSGFAPDNPLRSKGCVNFYVPCRQYGYVELAHGILSHGFLDLYMKGLQP